MPKEWQQLLQESGITHKDQERNPQAIMEVVKFYQETHAQGNQIWDKLGNLPAQPPPLQTPNTPGFFPGPPPPLELPGESPRACHGGLGRKPSIGASGAPTISPLPLQPYRPALTPPSTVPPALDRSNSGHTTPKSPTAIDQLVHSKAQHERNSAVSNIKRPGTAGRSTPLLRHCCCNRCKHTTNLPRGTCSSY